MSELLVNTIKKADGSGSLSVPAESGTVVTTASPSLGRRNLIINGAMQVAQRGTSVTGVTSSGYNTVDRFRQVISSLGTWTISQQSDAPEGYKYSLKYLCTTADASPASSDGITCDYSFETQDVRHLNYGSSDAKTITLSFWVKSNKTGNASVGLFYYDGSSNYFHSKQYTINTADTWEQKTVTISPNTSNTFRTEDTNAGLYVEWYLNSGSGKTSGSHDTWTTSQTGRNASNLGVGGAVNDYWQITGVQLEVGSVATPFEHRSYGEELQLCRRYFWKFGNINNGYFRFLQGEIPSTTSFSGSLIYPVEMRTAPSVSTSASSTFRVYSGGTLREPTGSLTPGGSTSNQTFYVSAPISGGTVGHGATLLQQTGATAYFDFDAEL